MLAALCCVPRACSWTVLICIVHARRGVVGGVLWRPTARRGVAHCVDVLRTSGPRGGVVYLRDALKKLKSGGIIGPGAPPAHIVQWDRARLPHLQWDRARPCHICAGTGLTLPHLHRDWTTSAPGLTLLSGISSA